MAVKLNSISFKNPLDSTPVNWLLANVGDEIVIEHNISIETSAIATTSAKMVANNTDGYLNINNITGGDFSNFSIGDQVQIYNYVTTNNFGIYTVIDKPDNQTLILNAAVGSLGGGYSGISPTTNADSGEVAVSVVKPITALYYKWNFVENSEGANFYSKIDGSTQMASITGLDSDALGTNKPMTMLGAKTYQIGSVEVDEIGSTDVPVYKSNFIIRHTTRITPIMLDTQYDDAVNGIAPAYFLNLKCLKSVFYYEARYLVNDPNAPQTLQKENILGNTGWMNERWNTGITNYSLSNVSISEDVAGVNTPIPAVKLSTTEHSKFSFDIENTTDSPIVAGQTKLVLNFCKAPNDEGEYTLNNRTVQENFVWESALLTVNTVPTPINGANYGTPTLQSLANLQAFYVSPTKITVTGNFDFNQLGIDIFEESNEPRYMFWTSIQDHAKTGANADRTNLLVDINPFFYQTEFPDLFTLETKLIPHDVNNFTDTFEDRIRFTEDEIVGFTKATLVPDALITSFVMTRVTYRLVAYHILTGNEFNLESKTIQFPATPLVNGYQFFDIELAKNIRVPSTEIRKNILAQRDTSGLIYNFAYPFLVRWEYWKELLSTSSFFFNTSEPFNGFNHDWVTYSTYANPANLNGWVLRYETEIGCKINDIPAIYKSTAQQSLLDRNLPFGGAGGHCEIDTYDAVSGTPLVDGSGKKFILGYKNTLVKAGFTLATGGTPFVQGDISVVIGIEIFEGGGVTEKRRMSTKYVSDSDTWFIPLTGETKTKLTFPTALSCLAEVEIDFNKLDLGKLKYKLTARLYGNMSVPDNKFRDYLKSQDVYLIPENPIDEETEVLAPEQLDCCSDLVWRVLADANSAEDLKNDKNTFLWWFNKDAVDIAVVSLYNSDGLVAVLTGSTTYGTPYDYGFYTNGSNEKLVGYEIDWKKVLTIEGAGTYYLKCEIHTIFGATSIKTSDTYCLKQFTVERANGTVRIEYNINGLLGITENDKKFRDLGQLNWYNQHRFDGYFHYLNGEYTEDYIKYPNGQMQWVADDQEPIYTMLIKPVPVFKHNILKTDILQSDEILVTDYNTRNIDNYYRKEVRRASGYDPIWHPMQSKLGAVTLKFKQRFNNLKKFRS